MHEWCIVTQLQGYYRRMLYKLPPLTDSLSMIMLHGLVQCMHACTAYVVRTCRKKIKKRICMTLKTSAATNIMLVTILYDIVHNILFKSYSHVITMVSSIM